MIDHDLWSMEGISRVFDGDPDGRFGLSGDDVLDNITFYWLTNTGFRRDASIGKASSASSTWRECPSR
jgi:hypothetical protein